MNCLPVRFPTKEVQIGQKVMRTAPTLQTRYELQENAVDAIAETDLLPFGLAGMLLALVQQQRLHVVLVDWRAGQI